MSTYQLILASSSKYRSAQLTQLGLAHTIKAPNIEEFPLPMEEAATQALRLALAKAAVICRPTKDHIVLGGDQTAVCEGVWLSKPGTPQAALEQLQWMRGKTSHFYSALALVGEKNTFSQVCETIVTMRQHDDASLMRYLEADTPFDCAGSFKIEQRGIALFEKVQSDDPSALTGLPLIALCAGLRTFGIQIP